MAAAQSQLRAGRACQRNCFFLNIYEYTRIYTRIRENQAKARLPATRGQTFRLDENPENPPDLLDPG